MKDTTSTANAHTPATLMALFANAFRLDQEHSLLWLKGVYQDRQRGSYAGYFFDRLKDEMSGQIVTLKVPAGVKQALRDQGLYLFKGYLDKDTRPDGVIEPVFVVAELSGPVPSALAPEMTTRAQLQRQKAAAGYRDLDRALAEKLRAGARPRLALIYGRTSIVHEDVNNALKGAAASYDMREHRTDLLASEQIVRTLAECNSEQFDAVAVVRGGGTGLEIFDDVRIAQVAVQMQPLLATAIGHARDVTLLQQVADRHFDTPTALGVYLREVVEHVREDKRRDARWPLDRPTLVALALTLLVAGFVLGVILSAWIK